MGFPVIRRSYLSVTGVLRLSWSVAVSAPAILRELRRARCDVVYVNTVTIPWWILAARLVGVPVLCHVHEAEDRENVWVQRAMAAPLLLADRVVLISRTAERAAHAVLPSLRRSSVVVLNGVPPRSGPPVPRPGGTRARLAHVARLSARKSQHVGITAVDRLRRRGIDVELELAGTVYPGNEAYEARLRQQVAELGLGDVVRFSGYVSPSSIVYDRADIVLSLSATEPLGNVVVEAQLAERPVIATATGGHLETIRDGVTGVHVPVADDVAVAAAVEQLLADPARAHRLATAGRESAATHFSTERYGDQIVALVHGLAGRPVPPGRARTRPSAGKPPLRHPGGAAAPAGSDAVPGHAENPGRLRQPKRRTPA